MNKLGMIVLSLISMAVFAAIVVAHPAHDNKMTKAEFIRANCAGWKRIDLLTTDKVSNVTWNEIAAHNQHGAMMCGWSLEPNE